MAGRRTSLALALLALGCFTPRLERQAWIEARSDTFRFVSQIDATRTARLARDLELFQAVIKRLTTAQDFEPRVPTTIVVFGNGPAYRSFHDSKRRGFFLAQQRANYALVNVGTELAEESSVLLHEYVHYIVRNDSAYAYPAWYDEGIAELLAATQIAGDTIAVGRVIPEHLSRLAGAPRFRLEELLGVQNPGLLSPARRDLFDAQAWIFVHYLQFGGQVGLPDRSTQVRRYLVLVNQGMKSTEACREAFGADFAALERELAAYLAKGMLPELQLARAGFPKDAELPLRTLVPSEVAAELGALALGLGNPARAETYFRAALADRNDHARAHFGLAQALHLQGRDEQVAQLRERGLALDPNDALNQLDYARALLERAATEPQFGPLLEQARSHLRRAIELDPKLPEAHAQLGASYLQFVGEDASRALPILLRAQELLSSDGEINYLTAWALLETGQLDEAQRLVAAARVQVQAQATLERLEQLTSRIERARTIADQTAPVPPPPSVGARP